MRPIRDADQGLRNLIATLEHHQEARRAYIGQVEELIELRQQEIHRAARPRAWSRFDPSRSRLIWSRHGP